MRSPVLSDVTAIRIGTRGSPLARWQASWVGEQLRARFPTLRVEYELVQTQGDRVLGVPLSLVGGKGLFVKEIEDALIAGRVDLAVHSVKDIPADLPAGLGLTAIPEREDPRDVLISSSARALVDLPPGARVGTSSLRRRAQLLYRREDLQIMSLRGNVDTRIRKLEAGQVDAVVLAAAGVRRMGLMEKVVQIFSPEEFVPAIGQGALGIETREDDPVTLGLVGFLDHGPTRLCVDAERAFLRELNGGCQVPIGALATIEGESVRIRGMVADVNGHPMLRDELSGSLDDVSRLGKELARRLLEQGAREILESLYGSAAPKISGP
jgi:hydroxymethylbilane synthase